MITAVVGTRNPTPEAARVCRDICAALRDMGHHLITGNADGIDSIARDTWNALAPGRVTLVLPWYNYNRRYIHKDNHVIVYTPQHKSWTDSVKLYHPAPEKLTQGVYKLHARNYGIIEPADIVIAFPSDKPGGGGTGQAIRIAQGLKKTLFVYPADIDSLLMSIINNENSNYYH